MEIYQKQGGNLKKGRPLTPPVTGKGHTEKGSRQGYGVGEGRTVVVFITLVVALTTLRTAQSGNTFKLKIGTP